MMRAPFLPLLALLVCMPLQAASFSTWEQLAAYAKTQFHGYTSKEKLAAMLEKIRSSPQTPEAGILIDWFLPSDDTQALRFLLNHGVSPDAPNEAGHSGLQSRLLYSMRTDQHHTEKRVKMTSWNDCCDILLEAGADINRLFAGKWTLLDYASTMGIAGITTDFLLSHGGKHHSPRPQGPEEVAAFCTAFLMGPFNTPLIDYILIGEERMAFHFDMGSGMSIPSYTIWEKKADGWYIQGTHRGSIDEKGVTSPAETNTPAP